MNSEIRRMLSGRGFGAALLAACAGILLGAKYPGMDAVMESGSFVKLETEALSSQMAAYLLPVAAVLPWSDSFLEELRGGFLKSYLPRIGRRTYVESKVFTVALGGALAYLTAGLAVLFFYFIVFFPMEKRGPFPMRELWELFAVLLRGGLAAASLASMGGICGALTGSVYMACGLPFVGYYFCMILQERYFPEALWLYPVEWLAGDGDWGAGGQGLWLFLLLLLAAAAAIHSAVLWIRLEEL